MGKQSNFEWDPDKDRQNQEKHGVAFALAQLASWIDTALSWKTLSTARKKRGITASVELPVES